MEALCITVERCEVPIGKSSQTKHIVVLQAWLNSQRISIELSASMRPLLGLIRERNLRGLQATMPTAVSVVPAGETYAIAEHDLSWWADRVREFHDQANQFS